jgi:hypothetical protein
MPPGSPLGRPLGQTANHPQPADPPHETVSERSIRGSSDFWIVEADAQRRHAQFSPNGSRSSATTTASWSNVLARTDWASKLRRRSIDRHAIWRAIKRTPRSARAPNDRMHQRHGKNPALSAPQLRGKLHKTKPGRYPPLSEECDRR